MRVLELKKKQTLGNLETHGVKLERNEEKTFKLFASLGFDVEVIVPRISEKQKNPDIFLLGATWEVKTPTSNNQTTLKNRFRNASKQSENIIFDLRMLNKTPEKAEKYLIDLFQKYGRARRMIIIEKDSKKVLEFSK